MSKKAYIILPEGLVNDMLREFKIEKTKPYWPVADEEKYRYLDRVYPTIHEARYCRYHENKAMGRNDYAIYQLKLPRSWKKDVEDTGICHGYFLKRDARFVRKIKCPKGAPPNRGLYFYE